LKNKKVLITGVAGFIGSNLADRLLAEGYQVVGIDNLAYGIKEQIPDKVDFYKMDIRKIGLYSLFKGVDIVFHLAAKNCISDCQNDPTETADINITGTVNVFEAARRAGVKKVIYAESSALYEGAKLFPTPEENVCPESFYALSKISGMYFAEAYKRYFNLNTTALRYFCVYGPKQDYRRTIPPLMSAFIIKLLKGQRPVIYGSGNKRRDFIYVDDINDFHILAMHDKRTDGQVYNLGSGMNYSVNEVFTIVRSKLGSRITPIYKKDLPGEAQTTLANIARAKKLGWKPKINIDQGINQMISWVREKAI